MHTTGSFSVGRADLVPVAPDTVQHAGTPFTIHVKHCIGEEIDINWGHVHGVKLVTPNASCR